MYLRLLHETKAHWFYKDLTTAIRLEIDARSIDSSSSDNTLKRSQFSERDLGQLGQRSAPNCPLHFLGTSRAKRSQLTTVMALKRKW